LAKFWEAYQAEQAVHEAHRCRISPHCYRSVSAKFETTVASLGNEFSEGNVGLGNTKYNFVTLSINEFALKEYRFISPEFSVDKDYKSKSEVCQCFFTPNC
jgi:hypothetical protein